jgi:hypothetical protein
MLAQGRLVARLKFMAVCLLALFCLLGCGLETFYYIDYIQASDYIDYTNSFVRLPSSGNEGYGGDNELFTHFVIFYRIYLSNTNPTGRINDSAEAMNSINTTMTSDYNWSITYTDIKSTTVNTSGLENTFYNRRFYKLELQDADIDNVLGRDRGARGSTLEIRFRDISGEVPVLLIGGTSYVLQRSNSGPGTIFRPRPTDSRAFLNHPELYSNENANTDINADAAPNNRGEILYTYVSMYIFAVGRSYEVPPTTIYSQPTFLGIFKLPQWS